MSTDTPTNDRGEFVLDNGVMYHRVPFDPATGLGPDTAAHEGAWLDCHGCNPPVVVDAARLTNEQGAIELTHLRVAYAAAKAEKDAATERFDAVKSKLQQALAEAANGALRAELRVPGYKPMTLVYTEPWTLDTKRLKAEQPAVYVEFAKRGLRWTLAESRGQ